jgi:proteasome lid subunit RPN8/RPN11
MLEQDYYGKREQVANEYTTKCEVAKIHGSEIPAHPGFPPYPSEADIIAKAQILNGFVSQIPNNTQEKTSKKST